MDFKDTQKIGSTRVIPQNTDLNLFIFGYNIYLIEHISNRYVYSKDFF